MALAWTRRLVAGLVALHRRGLVHGDISAVTVVTDGVRPDARATLAARGSGVSPLGTWSPERLRLARPVAADDVWAAGVFAFQVATGALPFSGVTGREVLADIAAARRPPLVAYGASNRRLDHVFDRIFAPPFDERVVEARVLADLLEAVMPGSPLAEGPPLTLLGLDDWSDARRCGRFPPSSGIV